MSFLSNVIFQNLLNVRNRDVRSETNRDFIALFSRTTPYPRRDAACLSTPAGRVARTASKFSRSQVLPKRAVTADVKSFVFSKQSKMRIIC